MTIKIPETYMGKPIKGAMELILASTKAPAVNTRKKSQPVAQALDLSGFIYVPAIELYVAREKTLHGKNWRNAHRGLQKQGLQMLTIPHFLEFVKYVQNNAVPDKDVLLNEIFEKRDPWRSEWLDAYFIEKKDEMYIASNHRLDTKDNKVKPQTTQKLEDCVSEKAYIDLMSANSQGLPTKKVKKRDVYYYPPSQNTVSQNAVAWFGADSGWACLDCDRDPSDSNSSLGVRLARPKN